LGFFPKDIPDGINTPPLVTASADKNERRLGFDLKLITGPSLFEAFRSPLKLVGRWSGPEAPWPQETGHGVTEA
jgi:hypothetical protein